MKSLDQIKDVLSSHKLEMFQKYHVKNLAIFGSYSRNEQNRKSDLDILVELDYRHRIGLEFIQMKLDLETILKQEVDLVSSKGISRHLEPINGSKELIYAR